MKIQVEVHNSKGITVGVRTFKGKNAIMDAREFKRTHEQAKLIVRHKVIH
jgi:hypothetical protein